MILSTGALLAYALAVAVGGPTVLRRSRWPERFPRLGIAVWQALSASTIAAVLLAGLSVAMPVMPFAGGLAGFLDTCTALLREQYASPPGAFATTAGLGLITLVAGRLGWAAARTAFRVARARRVQRRQLAVVARRDPTRGVVVLDHAEAAAYCLPGRGGQVVVTTGALQQLDARELMAVLAHERAHLRERHDLVVATATTLRDAFGFVPLFRAAADEVSRLVEMAADDVALRSADRGTLASALMSMAGAPPAVGSLGMGGSAAAARVRRLAAPSRPLGAARRLGALGAMSVVLTLPILLAAAPAFAVASSSYCPVIVTT